MIFILVLFSMSTKIPYSPFLKISDSLEICQGVFLLIAVIGFGHDVSADRYFPYAPRGKLLQLDRPEAVMAEPATDFVRELVRSDVDEAAARS